MVYKISQNQSKCVTSDFKCVNIFENIYISIYLLTFAGIIGNIAYSDFNNRESAIIIYM